MMTSKDRVKINVYKRLLEEEKKKNKKLLVAGASMFVMGIFSDNVVKSVMAPPAANPTKVAYEVASQNTNNDIVWENYFEGNVVKDKNLEINADTLFASDLEI